MVIQKAIVKRSIALILAFLLAVLMSVSVSADTSSSSSSVPTVTLPVAPTITSEGAIIIDAETGAILYEKNAHGVFHPASCTKILTAILALENGVLTDKISMSENAIWGIERGSSHIALDVGETVSINDLLHGLLIASGNECAMGLAEYTSAKMGGNGTVEDFATKMNQRAVELGAQNSHFVNPHGLYDTAHVSTPYDLAQLMRHAVQIETFVSISSTTQYTVCTDRVPTGHPFSHTNKLLLPGRYYNSDVICGKTGYTSQSGSSLVTYAQSGNTKVIVVTMGADINTVSFDDTNALLNYCFANFTKVTPTETDKATGSLSITNGVDAPVYSDLPQSVLLPRGVSFRDLTPQLTANASLTLPIPANAEIGTVRWYYADREFASAKLYAAQEVLPPAPEEDLLNNKTMSVFGKILLIAAIVLVSLVLLFFIAAFINRTIRRLRRKRRRHSRVHQNRDIFR